jgi:hypothetical protein
MGRRITETLDATIQAQLFKVDGWRRHRLFEGTGRNSGLEAAGDLERLKEIWRSEQQAD